MTIVVGFRDRISLGISLSSMATTTKFMCIVLCLLPRLHPSLSGPVSGQMGPLESVPELEKSMYITLDGYPCVRLLNLSGEIGCANPGRDKVVAPILKFDDALELAQASTILVSEDKIQSFFTRLLKDSKFAMNIGGVLVESKTELQKESDVVGFSPVEKFPQAEFAPYERISYEWNPNGFGIIRKPYNFPVFLLSPRDTLTLQEVALKNAERGQPYAVYVAEFNLVMQTTKAGTHDSESCLKEWTCLPLGGYSVWSSLPPINMSSSKDSKPIILAVASMDSASFFRDKSLGADSSISGLIALLAAVDALSHVEHLNDLSKQLVFLVFTGEAWGYLGSRRFLFELDLHTDAVLGINSTLIDMVMEIGSVGKGFHQGTKSIFAHATGASSAKSEMLNAINSARDSLGSESVEILQASNSNPGVPPSSLMTFLRKDPKTTGIILEDFDSVFTNKFYHSHLDDFSNINSSSIIVAASIVARSLYILAHQSKDLGTSALSAINVNASLIEELIDCLVKCEPGLSCSLVRSYISPRNTCPSNYVGVVLGEPSSTPHPESVTDISRFVWNFLAQRTSRPRENAATSACPDDCSNAGEVCIKTETDGKGECVTSTTRYVPAYSTRLRFESERWNVLPADSSDPMGMVDPVWTESNWDVITLRLYAVEDAGYDRLVLLGGCTLTVIAYIATVVARSFITKALKQD